MDIDESSAWIDSEFEFPLENTTVLNQAGDLEIDAPDLGDSETLQTILQDAGEETYHSKEELITAIRGNLSDEYVGRKYYDDRGANPPEQNTQRDTTDESF